VNKYDSNNVNNTNNPNRGTSKQKLRNNSMDVYPIKNKERPNRILEENIPKLQFTEPEVITSVLVENFPSRQEIFDMIEDFFDEYNLDRDFKTNNRGLSLEIYFKTMNIGYDFIKYFNLEKLKNPLYKKSKASILLETKQPKHMPFSPKNVRIY